MRRAFIAALAAAAFLVSAAPVLAQTQDKPTSPTEPAPPVTIEPAQVPVGLEVSGTNLSVDGKEVEAAPTGVEVTFVATFRNFGSGSLKDVKVRFADGGSIRFTDAEATLGDLAPDAEAEGTFAFVVAATECFEFVGFGGEASFEGGSFPLKVGIPAACPGPRLSIRDVTFEGGDGDGVAEPGETLRVSFELVNDGKDPATNVRATVKVSGDGVSAAGTELAWPNVEPGGSARNTAPMIVSIPSDAKRQESCEGVQPLPMPVEDGGNVASDQPLPPDAVVSSDGTVSSGGSSGTASGSEPASGGGSEPNTGQSEPGSPGDGTTTEEPPAVSILPAPGTLEPQPGGTGGTEPGVVEPVPPDGTPEPAPEPKPTEPAPNPEPSTDQPVLVEAQFEITAAEYKTAFEWSNGVFCAFERGLATDAMPLAANGARDDAGAGGTGGAAVPVTVALGISAVAAVLHRKLVA